MKKTQLSFNELERYSRHLLLPEIGKEGQLKLLNSRVLIVGLGGLGSPVSLYLAAAGVRNLGLMDSDVVDASNLQRQIVHTEETVKRPKVMSAAAALEELDSNMSIEVYHEHLTESNADVLDSYDVVVDCLDNFPGKLLINDACFFERRPFVHAGVLRFGGQVTTFDWKNEDDPCLRCIVPSPPPADVVPTCSRAGVLGAAVGVIGSVQAMEVIKLITGLPTLSGKIFSYDALKGGTYVKKHIFKRDPDCPLCGSNPTIHDVEDEQPAKCDLKDDFLK